VVLLSCSGGNSGVARSFRPATSHFF